jgi:hypothetical protein
LDKRRVWGLRAGGAAVWTVRASFAARDSGRRGARFGWGARPRGKAARTPERAAWRSRRIELLTFETEQCFNQIQCNHFNISTYFKVFQRIYFPFYFSVFNCPKYFNYIKSHIEILGIKYIHRLFNVGRYPGLYPRPTNAQRSNLHPTSFLVWNPRVSGMGWQQAMFSVADSIEQGGRERLSAAIDFLCSGAELLTARPEFQYRDKANVLKPFVDPTVYTNNRQFQLLLNCKLSDSTRTALNLASPPTLSSFSLSCITYIGPDVWRVPSESEPYLAMIS